MLFQDFIRGLAGIFLLSASPLYRYPYRSAAEAFMGDWKRIAGDVSATLERPE